jgi:phosphoglycerol transferase MdoB-like AlkP superfamily enzyme
MVRRDAPPVSRARRLLLGRFGSILAFAAVFLALETAVRLALLARAWPSLHPGPALIARVFAAGFLYDAVAASWALVPAAVLLALMPRWLLGSRPGRAAGHAVFVVAVFVVLFSAVAEWLFWSEFGSRFNFIAVDYLVYTREVTENIWESYPVAPVMALLGAVAFAIWWPWRSTLDAGFRTKPRPAARLAAVGVLAGSVCLGFFGVDDRFAQVSQNRYGRELAENGLYQLFSAFRVNSLEYAPFYVSETDDLALRRAHQLLAQPDARFVSDDPDELARDVRPAGPEQRRNVVLVVVESLSADFLDVLGGHLKLTPNLNALAEQSVLFTKLYATGTRTVRGLEAITLSVPPTPGNSIVRRPGNDGLTNIGTPFLERGYDVRFIYGGYSVFDNMGAFFGGNGFQVVDRSSFAPDEVGFANAWGVADEDLFRKTLREADASHAAGRPFFSLLMTTSNHRPYTYPEGRVSIPSGTGRDGGVQYTDWAIGDFLRQARTRPWFDDTVFVIVADHCASSLGKTDIPVRRYRIPLLIYAPAFLQPRRIDGLASQIDVAPTLLGLLGFSYRSHFFGRDQLSPVERGDPRAFLATYQRLGFLRDDLLTILSPGSRVDAFQVGRRGKTLQPAQPQAEPLADAIALYQSASFAWRRGLLRKGEAVRSAPRVLGSGTGVHSGARATEPEAPVVREARRLLREFAGSGVRLSGEGKDEGETEGGADRPPLASPAATKPRAGDALRSGGA